MHQRIADSGCSIDRVVNHGIAFGCYFRDPEDNELGLIGRVREENPPAIGLDRPPDAERQRVAVGDGGFQPDHGAGRQIGRTIQHQAERA